MVKLFAAGLLVAGFIWWAPALALAAVIVIVIEAFARRDRSTMALCVVALPLLAGAWMGWGWAVVALVPLLAGWAWIDLRRSA